MSNKKSFYKILKVLLVPLIAVIAIVLYLIDTTNFYNFNKSEVVNNNGILYLNTARNVKFVGREKCYSCHGTIYKRIQEKQLHI